MIAKKKKLKLEILAESVTSLEESFTGFIFMLEFPFLCILIVLPSNIISVPKICMTEDMGKSKSWQLS